VSLKIQLLNTWPFPKNGDLNFYDLIRKNPKMMRSIN